MGEGRRWSRTKKSQGPDLIEQPGIKREILEGGGIEGPRETTTVGRAGAKKERNGPGEGEG